MKIYGDTHFICYLGAPKWLPESFGFQVWFWHPGLNSQYQKESEQQRQKQIPKGLYYRLLYILKERLSSQPYRFSDLWPLGSSLVLYEIEECDSHEERIVQGLSRQQIESKITAIKKLLLGIQVKSDFVERLRLSG